MMLTEFIDITLLALLAVTGLALLKLRNLVAVVILTGIYSLLCAGLFLVMEAPDVAITEAAVGVGIATVLLVGALTLVGQEERPPEHSRMLPLTVVLLTGGMLVYGILDVPPFGAPDNPVQAHVTPHYLEEQEEEIGVPNLVGAVLASYRGYDTLGETTVIFAAGIGVLLLLAGGRERRGGAGEVRAEAEAVHRPRPVEEAEGDSDSSTDGDGEGGSDGAGSDGEGGSDGHPERVQ